MSDLKSQVIAGWLTKAKHDLQSAKVLSQDKSQILDTAIYHCQQAAEKSIKGFLASKDKEIIKTHDIGLLIQEATKLDADFLTWQESAEILTPYATLYRYPGTPDDPCEPSIEEVHEAIRIAESLLNLVNSKISQ